MDSPYSESDAARDEQGVIDCLHRSGWIENSWEFGSRLVIQWTEKGKEGVARLYELYESAGGAELNGRQVALFGLIAFASQKAGVDAKRVSMIGETDLSRCQSDLRPGEAGPGPAVGA